MSLLRALAFPLALLAACLCSFPAQAQAQRPAAPAPAKAYDFAFERDLYKTRFEHEVQFRAAAIHVAWAAEALCHATAQIEPFVLLSTHALRRRLEKQELELLREVTGLDEKWRVVWADESAPDDLKLRDVVTAINDRKLPAGATRFEIGAMFSGGSMVAQDDQGFWDVLHQARREAGAGKPMVITLEDGRKLKVETQTGCAGSVTASSFDADADTFKRLGNQRVKIPANAMIAARDRDELRWLAAFGTYFQASQEAIQRAQRVDGLNTGFTVGRFLSMVVPGSTLLVLAAEAQAERQIVVEGVMGGADLFANEVVVALGGDVAAGLRLSERMRSQGLKVDVVMMDERRRSNAAEHARRIQLIQAAEAEAERKEAQRQADAQREAQRQPLILR